ncbi:MAG: class I SAM-dependent methyltransferase [Planctomycetota bacterium]
MPGSGVSDLEEVACPGCGDDCPVQTRYEQDGMKIQRCSTCSLFYLSPRLTEAAMESHYRSNTYFEGGDSGYDSYEAQSKSLRMTFRRLLRTLDQRRVRGQSCLDVGCGYGYFLQEASPYFAERVGTDYSSGALEKASAYATEVLHGGLEQIEGDRTFDLITALHVIEHVYDPRAFVGKMYDHLKPGGTLLLAAPHMGSFWRFVLGHKWPSFKYPEHVSYFGKATMKRLIGTTGGVDIKSFPYPHAFPLDLVLSKLKIPASRWMENKAVWLPATTVAMTIKKPETPQATREHPESNWLREQGHRVAA